MRTVPVSISGKSALDVAIQTAKNAGQYIYDNFYSVKNVKQKGRGNFASNIDTNSEKIIIESLRSEFPDWQFISEESYPDNAIKGYTWIIDPLDGTSNSVFGLPLVSVNIALANNDGIYLGVTYDPLRKELFHTLKGEGAYLNGAPIKASSVKRVEDSLVCLDLGYSKERGMESIKVMQSLWGKALCLRILGSAALCLAYVACGRVNLYYHRHIFPWDIASGLLMVKEAGGEVIDWKNQPAELNSMAIIASNKDLNRDFLKIIDNPDK